MNISGPKTPFQNRNFILGGGLLVAIALLLIALRLPTPEPVTNTGVLDSPPLLYATTPESYDDFIGTITAIDGSTVTVVYTIIASDGAIVEKTRRVIVDATTKLEKHSVDEGTFIATSALKDLVVGQRVIAASADNIATVESFTATSLTLLISSTPTP